MFVFSISPIGHPDIQPEEWIRDGGFFLQELQRTVGSAKVRTKQSDPYLHPQEDATAAS